MVEENTKKYNILEEKLQNINGNFVYFSDEEKKTYNPILEFIVSI